MATVRPRAAAHRKARRVNGLPRLLLALLVLCSASCSRARREPQAAEIIFENAAVYTMDSARSWADAVALAGGKITYVGDVAGADRLKGKQTRVISLNGRMILPSFHDSHIHLLLLSTVESNSGNAL